MVGYHRKEVLTPSQKLIAGALAGVVTRFSTQPLDIVKLRTQLQKVRKKRYSMFQTAGQIFREEGITAFWQGHVLGQVHSILSVTSQFYMYELTTKASAKYLRLDHKYRYIDRFICGVMAGCVSTTLVIPLEVIRVRQMLIKDQYGGLLKGAMAVFRYGGFLAFYEGLSASCLQMGPQVGISFLVFSIVQPKILALFKSRCKTNEECTRSVTASSILIASSIAGSLAGLTAKTATYPFDLTKRRLQIGSHKDNQKKYVVPTTSRHLTSCKDIISCIRNTYKRDGLLGLYRGWLITVTKAQFTSVFAFGSYELFCHLFREYGIFEGQIVLIVLREECLIARL